MALEKAPAPRAGHTGRVHLRDVGPHALLVEVDDARAAAALASWVRSLAGSAERPDEVVPGARTVLLDGVADRESLRRLLARWPGPSASAAGPGPGDPVEPVARIAVRLDGEDLADVARRWGTDADGVGERLAGLDLVSAFCGFAPGFAYLSGLPAGLAVPRLASPRPRVRAGSVALADRWCAVYPAASPGGWRVVGHTDAVVWDVDRDPPALLAPGTRVRFAVL